MYLEIIEKQSEIIKSQSDMIAKLYNLLSQYITIDEIEESIAPTHR